LSAAAPVAGRAGEVALGVGWDKLNVNASAIALATRLA
jgi:hypothetical protein